MPSVSTLAELKALADEELVSLYDQIAPGTTLGMDFVLSEIRYREQQRLTKQIMWLTGIILIATVVNVVFVAFSLVWLVT